MPRLRLRKSLRSAMMNLLPQEARFALYRRMIALDLAPAPQLKFRVAREKHELEAAFRLLHDAYVRTGYMAPHPSGMRVTKWHALPSTSTLIALWDGEVVGTVSLLRRHRFGTPMEKVFDLSHVTEAGARITEISALAIRRDYSGRKGQILFPLCKFLFEYSQSYFGATHFAISVVPQWFEFYEALLRFKPLMNREPQRYAAANGVMAIGGLLDLRSVEAEGRRIYAKAPDERNFYKYMYKTKFDCFEFPKRAYYKISDPVLTPDLLDYFFNRRTDVFSRLDAKEIFLLHELYRTPAFRAVLPPLAKRAKSEWHERGDIRLEVRCEGALEAAEGVDVPVDLVEVSRKGVRALLSRGVRVDQVYRLRAKIGRSRTAEIRVIAQWANPGSGAVGFRIVEASPEWMAMIERLEADVLRAAA